MPYTLTNFYLYALTDYLPALAILGTLSVRIHTGVIMFKPWVRLWYLCRAIDLAGTGYVEFLSHDLCQLLNIKNSTLYQWLRLGKAAGTFRDYYKDRQRGVFCIWLGSLKKYSLSLGKDEKAAWGTTATVPLALVNSSGLVLKAHATAIETQNRQVKSRIAATRSLKERERKIYRLPEVHAIIKAEGQSSPKPVQGQVPFLLSVGSKFAFVSRSWIPFGTSQASVAKALEVSDRTVRRHLDHLAVDKKQVVQAKSYYKTLVTAMEHDVPECWIDDYTYMIAEPQAPWGVYALRDRNGVTLSQYKTQVTSDRFFKYGGKTWMYRTNLYDLDYQITSMRAARKDFDRLRSIK